MKGVEYMDKSKCWLIGDKKSCNQKDCNSSFCMKFFKLNYLYEASLIPLNCRRHKNLVLDKDNKDLEAFKRLFNIEQDINNFVAEGYNLFLHSNNTGNGKTSWALRLAQAYLNGIWKDSALTCRVLFISVPRFLIALKDNISDKQEYIAKIKENVYSCDLVIWDDIGTKAATSFEAENLLSLIDTRINYNKSNIFTSNLNSNEIHNFFGDRLASRIVNNSVDIELFGKDKRGLNL